MLSLFAGIMPIIAAGAATASANTTATPAPSTSVSEQNVHGTYEGKSAMHNVNGKGFFLTADFIYWEASEDNLIYGTKITKEETVYKNLGLAFQWEPGCKVGAGYTFSYDGWDLYANWTHLNSKATGSAKVVDNGEDEIVPFWVPALFNNGGPGAGVGNEPYANARSRWLLFYNTIDLELGRNYFNSKALSFRPHFGVRAAWIDQKVSANYYNPTSGGIGPNTNLPESFKSTFNYGGYGMRAGIDALFHISSAWALYAKAAGSLLYGQVHIRNRAAIPRASAVSVGEFTAHLKNSSNYWRGRFNVEGALGIEWETFFHDKESHLAFALGYEFTDWLRLNLINPEGGDLFLQGLTFSARYDF